MDTTMIVPVVSALAVLVGLWLNGKKVEKTLVDQVTVQVQAQLSQAAQGRGVHIEGQPLSFAPAKDFAESFEVDRVSQELKSVRADLKTEIDKVFIKMGGMERGNNHRLGQVEQSIAKLDERTETTNTRIQLMDDKLDRALRGRAS
jgi:hypothetical protein